MKNKDFVSSHPTGVPAGLTDLMPVIINQSPELASRSLFEDQRFEEDVMIGNEMFEKSYRSMSNYEVATVPYRGRDYEPHECSGSYTTHHQTAFTSSSLGPSNLATSRDIQTSSHPATASAPSILADLRNSYYLPPTLSQNNVFNWGPQQGVVGTQVQVSLVLPCRVDPSRLLTAKFGQDDCEARYEVLEANPQFRYLVSCRAPVQHATQWSKPKSAIPLSLIVPVEEPERELEVSVGKFVYLDSNSLPAQQKAAHNNQRIPSVGTFDSQSSSSARHERDFSSEHSTATYGQLPPIRDGNQPSSFYSPSMYSASCHSEDFPSPQSASPHYYASGLAYSNIPACAPSAPPWLVSASSDIGASAPENVVTLTNEASIGSQGIIKANPVFVRKKNDQVAGISSPTGPPQNSNFNPYSLYPNHKAILHLMGDLSAMTRDWNGKEKQDKRRLVQWNRTQEGSVIRANFEGVDPDFLQKNSAVVSCIWWEAKNEFYVTSVDTIALLEKLVSPDGQFTVEEKNRIRRNLEGFHPETISKNKPATESFFKLIMNFPAPRPRHIEKDVKVFKWATLEVALKKIISKYTASYASTMASNPKSSPSRQAERSSHAQQEADLGSMQAGLTLPYPGPVLSSHSQQMPASTTLAPFSDQFSHQLSHHLTAPTPSYPSFATQPQQYVQDSQMLLPNQRHVNSFGGYVEYNS